MTSRREKKRLDLALVSRGLVSSRARARDLIQRGEVTVDGVVAHRAAAMIDDSHAVVLAPGAGNYISRGALKLRAALDHFGFDTQGRIALDIGASTGGFTEVLLERGARRVYAVENGHDQLHATLRADARVVSLEGTDARQLTHDKIPDRIGAIVADVSFISLTKALPAALRFAGSGCWLAALVKPQFESQPPDIPRSGVITDLAVRNAALANVRSWISGLSGWRIVGDLDSPVKGGDGNAEFLIGAVYED